MSRRKSDRMKLLQRLASKREEAAARALGKSQQNLQNQQGRLNELGDFMEDYQTRFQQEGQHGMTGATLQRYQQFLNQLDQAIDHQHGTIAAAQDECKRKQQQWQERHQKTQMYDKTVQRALSTEQKIESKREQRELDDRPKRK